MAHFAQLDENNVVINVLVVNNSDIGDLPFPESEPVGNVFLNTLFPNTRWVQTSYNHSFRVRYAAIGFTFNPLAGTDKGGFSPPKPYSYFVFDDVQCMWVPPIPYPSDGNKYHWSDDKRTWVLDSYQDSITPIIIG